MFTLSFSLILLHEKTCKKKKKKVNKVKILELSISNFHLLVQTTQPALSFVYLTLFYFLVDWIIVSSSQASYLKLLLYVSPEQENQAMHSNYGATDCMFPSCFYLRLICELLWIWLSMLKMRAKLVLNTFASML